MALNKSSKIYIAGHNGLVGRNVTKVLIENGYNNLVLKSRSELDLLNRAAVEDFFKKERPDCVVDCAAMVGSIKDNIDRPAEYLYYNLQLQNNLIWTAKETSTKKFLFISSAVVYPSDCPQPIKEEYFLQGEPAGSKGGYAFAKIIGTKLCEYIHDEHKLDFITCAPTNLYGPGDNFDPESSHVIPALLRRFHEAKLNGTPEVIIWGSGNSRREFLHISDLAKSLVWMLENYNEKQVLNVGTGEDVSIKELAHIIKDTVGYEGRLVFDSTKPEGAPRRLYDTSKINDLGWKHKVRLEDGIKETYTWYLENIVNS